MGPQLVKKRRQSGHKTHHKATKKSPKIIHFVDSAIHSGPCHPIKYKFMIMNTNALFVGPNT